MRARAKHRILLASTALVAAIAPAVSSAATGQVKTIRANKTALKFDTKSVVAKPGKFTLKAVNLSTAPHRLAVRGGKLNFAQLGKKVGKGGTSSVSFTLEKGKSYVFFCQVPGHETAGMRGRITVK